MKRSFIVLVLAGGLLAVGLMLTACGGSDDSSSTTEDTSAQTESTETTESTGTESTDNEQMTDYPTGPITIRVGHGVGGGTDTVIRTIQPYLEEALGVPIVVENIKGAGGMVNIREWMNEADPDGYTLVANTNPSYILKQGWMDDPIDFQQFEWIASMTRDSNGLIVSAESDVMDYDQFLQKAEEEELIYSSTGGVSNSTLGYAMLINETGVAMNNLPYNSGSEANLALIGQHSDVGISALASIRSLLDNGDVRMLTYFAEDDMQEFPDVPRFGSMYEGDPGYSTTVGILAPGGTPKEIVSIIEKAVDEAMKDPAYSEAAAGKFVTGYMGSDEYTEYGKSLQDYREANADLIDAAVIPEE